MPVDDCLVAARSMLRRLTAREAASAHADGALLVDIRPVAQRRADGEIPGALVIERNVLEWRLDPTGDHRLPELRDADQLVIVVCDEGYASSLAAASLQSVGLPEATDVFGGYQAWLAAGLPTRPAAADPELRTAVGFG
jgi:rhodanese-related sulfurtransferase